jgi:hypothetical protein
VLKLTTEPQSTRAWAIGARGEELLAAALADIPGIQLLHDRRVPHTQGNIDHIVIAPAGIFVVDAKYWDGTIRIRNVGSIFRRDDRLFVGRRDCSKLARKMTWQVEAVQSALQRSGIDPTPSIRPVLCFVDGDWPLFGAPDEFEGVRLESERSIRKLFTITSEIEPEPILMLTRALAIELPSKGEAPR